MKIETEYIKNDIVILFVLHFYPKPSHSTLTDVIKYNFGAIMKHKIITFSK